MRECSFGRNKNTHIRHDDAKVIAREDVQPAQLKHNNNITVSGRNRCHIVLQAAEHTPSC